MCYEVSGVLVLVWMFVWGGMSSMRRDRNVCVRLFSCFALWQTCLTDSGCHGMDVFVLDINTIHSLNLFMEVFGGLRSMVSSNVPIPRR